MGTSRPTIGPRLQFEQSLGVFVETAHIRCKHRVITLEESFELTFD